MIVNPTDYFLYLPLLPEVAAGHAGAAPGRRCSLADTLPGVDLVLGEVDGIDLGRADGRTTPIPRASRGELSYDRLVIAAGSVNKLLPVPGVTEHAHGFRGIPEALYLRDHITRQIELAGRHRRSRGTGGAVHVRRGRRGIHRHRGGRAGRAVHRRSWPATAGRGWRLSRSAGCCSTSPTGCCPRWTSGCPRTADAVLRERGVEVRMGPSVQEATLDGVGSPTATFVTHPVADLVRRGAARPAGRGIWAWTTRAGPAAGRRVPERARPSRRVRLRRRRGRARPDAARRDHRDDRAARRTAGRGGRRTTSPPRSGADAAAVQASRPRVRRRPRRARRGRQPAAASRCPGCPPRSSPAATTCCRCRATGSARPPTGCTTWC